VNWTGRKLPCASEIARRGNDRPQQKPLFVERGFGSKECEAIWQIRREFSYALRDTGLTKLNEDIVVPRGKLESLFQIRRDVCERNTACPSPASATPATATSTRT
jgi:FAD/FMN-containing dehydrogenase